MHKETILTSFPNVGAGAAADRPSRGVKSGDVTELMETWVHGKYLPQPILSGKSRCFIPPGEGKPGDETPLGSGANTTPSWVGVSDIEANYSMGRDLQLKSREERLSSNSAVYLFVGLELIPKFSVF